MASGDTKTESYLRVAAEGTRADLPSDACCNTKTQNLILGVANRIMDVEDEVEELKNNPDVADIVETYADLQNYGTSTLTDKDVVRVLQDETHDGDSTYYRYSTSTGDFTYIGESKQYTDFVGTDGQTAGASGLVPAPATTDADKFLKSDGTWDTAGGGSTINVVQTVGTSQTDVMSQNATTSMVFADAGTNAKIRISNENNSSIGTYSVRIGRNIDSATGNYCVSIGDRASAVRNNSIAMGQLSGGNSSFITALGNEAKINGTTSQYSTAIGAYALVGSSSPYAVAIGANSNTTSRGEVSFGGSTLGTNGYNNTNYRLLTNVYDGQSAHDAVTKGQLDTAIVNGGTTAPTTATVGAVGTLYSAVVSNTAHLYACTAIDDTTDPQNPSYTWTILV